MSIRTSPWPAGTPCWIDLTTPDVKAAQVMYAAATGWEFQEQGENFGGYLMCTIDGHLAAGMGPIMQEGATPSWTVYLASDDLAATGQAIGENGGQVVAGPHDVADFGKMLIAVDPGGAPFGVWQHGRTIGAELVNQPGGLVWEECWVADPAAVQPFYAAVFGFTFEDVPGAPQSYAIFAGPDGIPLGGIGTLEAGLAPHWLPYIAVPDTDLSVAAITNAGGTVAVATTDTPHGRMATVTDPAGARISFIQPSDGQPDRSG